MTTVVFYVAKQDIHIGTNVIFKGTLFWRSFFELPMPPGMHGMENEFYEQVQIFPTSDWKLNGGGALENYERT